MSDDPKDDAKTAFERVAKQMAEFAKPFEEIQKQLEPLRALQAQLKPPNLAIPVMPEIPKIEVPTNPNLASEFYKRLVAWIKDFDESLDDKYEVGVRLVNFGQTFTFHLNALGYWNPSLISFKGITDKDEPVELIQHVTQISILLMKVPRKNLDQPKRPIGFAAWPKSEEPDV